VLTNELRHTTHKIKLRQEETGRTGACGPRTRQAATTKVARSTIVRTDIRKYLFAVQTVEKRTVFQEVQEQKKVNKLSKPC
jgi:hypothetical protein